MEARHAKAACGLSTRPRWRRCRRSCTSGVAKTPSQSAGAWRGQVKAVARSQNSLSRPTVGSSSSCSFPLFLRMPRPFVGGEAGQAPDFASVPQPSTHTQSPPRLHPLKLLQPGPAAAVGSLPPPPTPGPSSATLLPFAAPCDPPL